MMRWLVSVLCMMRAIQGFNELDKAVSEGSLEAHVNSCLTNLGMSIWIVSHGGVGSNSLAQFVESMGLRVRTQSWHAILCHSSDPIRSSGRTIQAAVYLYGDPVLSICSMKRQGNAYLNLQKLTNRLNVNVHYTDGLLMEAIYGQFKRWTSPEAERGSFGYKIYHLSHEDIFKTECLGLFIKRHYAKLFKRSRSNSNRQKCLSKLDLRPEHIAMADEMTSYKGDCSGVLSQIQVNTTNVSPQYPIIPQRIHVPQNNMVPPRFNDRQEANARAIALYKKKQAFQRSIYRTTPRRHPQRFGTRGGSFGRNLRGSAQNISLIV